jgi:hypothetical protein
MFFRVKLDGQEYIREASDSIDAIRIARETHPATDVIHQSAEQVSEDEEAFFQSEKMPAIPFSDSVVVDLVDD